MQNSIIVADVKLPLRQQDPETAGGIVSPFLTLVQRVPLPAPACRVRSMPQNTRITAVAMLGGGGVSLMRRASYSERVIQDPEECMNLAQITPLEGYEGKQATFGLCWDPHKTGRLLAAGVDGAMCMWDVARTSVVVSTMSKEDPSMSRETGPARVLSTLSGEPVLDACFHPKLADLAGIVRGGKVALWDTRGGFNEISDSGARLNSLSFCPTQEQYFVTGGSDGKVCI